VGWAKKLARRFRELRVANPEWKVRELADGWKGTFARVLAPAGVIEIAALGLKGCEVRFSFDGESTETKPLGHDIAKMFRPIQPGSHQIGIEWRGPAHAPTEAGARFHPLIETLAALEREAPDIAAVMKKNNLKGFVLVDAFVLSQPTGMPCQVYGIFTVDRKALASGLKDAPVIKQDFLVNDRSATPQEITYYTGLPGEGPYKRIEEFCERFGAPNYGCELVGGRWRCRDHHFSLKDLEHRPMDLTFRREFDAAIKRARADAQGGSQS